MKCSVVEALRDLSITRTTIRWHSVPAKSPRFYVWFDALTLLSAVGVRIMKQGSGRRYPLRCHEISHAMAKSFSDGCARSHRKMGRNTVAMTLATQMDIGGPKTVFHNSDRQRAQVRVSSSTKSKNVRRLRRNGNAQRIVVRVMLRSRGAFHQK